MRVLIQRVKYANVKIDNKIVGSCDKGLLLLVGFTQTDNESLLPIIVNKIINLRIFEDDQGKMNLSLLDVKGSILSISQFTLYADARKGRRPSFTNALNPNDATVLYDMFNDELRENNIEVGVGVFGADMQVELVNDGPVTIMIDSNDL